MRTLGILFIHSYGLSYLTKLVMVFFFIFIFTFHIRIHFRGGFLFHGYIDFCTFLHSISTFYGKVKGSPRVAKGLQGSRGTPGLVEMS